MDYPTSEKPVLSYRHGKLHVKLHVVGVPPDTYPAHPAVHTGRDIEATDGHWKMLENENRIGWIVLQKIKDECPNYQLRQVGVLVQKTNRTILPSAANRIVAVHHVAYN